MGKIPRQAVKRLPAGFDRRELFCTVLFEKMMMANTSRGGARDDADGDDKDSL